MLGELYEHAPESALIIDMREEAERAFHRAIELDPEFAMFYWHPIEYALARADSARAFSLIETHGRLAPGSERDRGYRLALALGFGDSASRGRALAALDTVETGVLNYLVGPQGVLRHPSNLPIATEVLRIARDRPDAPWFLFHVQLLGLAELGQFDAAMNVLDDVLDDPAVPPWARKVDLFRLYGLGMDLSPDQLAREFALTAADTTADGAFAHFVAGVVSADQGRWGDHEAVLARARGEVRRHRAVGDTTAARMFDGVARALQGYALWKRGQSAEALPQLEAVQRDMRGSAGTFGLAEQNLNDAVRWWLGQLLGELDRPRDALVYFRTRETGGPGWMSLAKFESAKIYEELGEFEKARESYEYALLAWRDADPELRPRIQAAREGLARLPKPLRHEDR
jgi:tetratricopeptide (TPR) repeat protein